MKILFISQIVPYPPHGGVLQRGYNIIREIAKYNEIHLLAFVHPDTLTSPAMIAESRTELEKYCAAVEYFPLWPKKSRLHKYGGLMLGLFSSRPFSFLAHRSRALRKRIEEILADGNIDLIHCDTIALAQYFEREWNIPAVLTHHNIESELMNRRAEVEGNPLARFYLKREVSKLRAAEIAESVRFDINITMSEVDAQKLRELAPHARTAVIPNGVDLDYFKPITGLETNSVIYTGGMNMFANKDAVLYFINDILPRIKAGIPEIEFYIIGQDPPPELIRMARQDRGLQVLGYVDDVRPHVAKAGVYIVPLRVGGGTRLKVLDALAQGKAIVSTSIGCEGIQVESGKNVFIEDDEDRFAERVLELLRNDAARRKLGCAARELAHEKYGWRASGVKLNQIYTELLNT